MKRFSLLFLVLVNLLPIPGFFFLDWNLFSILLFYWLESGVVGVYNIAKMAIANPSQKSHRLSGIIFFLIHYSAFMAGHGFAIFELFNPVGIQLSNVIFGLISLFVSHGISFVTNFIGHREYERVSLSQQMIAPYKRIMIMHITIILCGFLLNLFEAPEVTLIILVILKIVIDVRAHVMEHGKLGTYAVGKKNWLFNPHPKKAYAKYGNEAPDYDENNSDNF